MLAVGVLLLCRLGFTAHQLHSIDTDSRTRHHGREQQQQGALRARQWRQAVLQSTLPLLPELSGERLGALMVAAVKLELNPPVPWVQVRMGRGAGQASVMRGVDFGWQKLS